MKNEIKQYINIAKDQVNGKPPIPQALDLMAEAGAVLSPHHHDIVHTRVCPQDETINGAWGIELVASTLGSRLARCGFEYLPHFDSLLIEHTPQGILMNGGHGLESRILNKARDFRELMLRDVILLATELGLQKVIAIGASNHDKVFNKELSRSKAREIIDNPLKAVGFVQNARGDFYHNIEQI